MDNYIDYIKRFCRAFDLDFAEANKLKICRSVGRTYGLSDADMDEIDWREKHG